MAKAPPDGYTIMMGHVSVNAIAPALFSNLSYDVLKDFAPIALAAAVPHRVTIHPSLQVNSLRELITYLKSQPGKLTFPSKGSGQSMQDLLGGQHRVALDTMPASSPHVRSGKLRALAALVRADTARYARLVKEIGLRMD